MNKRSKCLLVAVSLAATIVLAPEAYGNGAKKQQPPLVTLQASGSVIGGADPVLSISPSADGQTLYAVNGLTGEVEAYGSEPYGFLRPLGKVLGAVRGPHGYSAKANRDLSVTVWDGTGRVSAKFKPHPPDSLAFLGDGRLLVASPAGGRLLHLYSPDGRLIKSFGKPKAFDRTNEEQNQFLHRGEVLVDAADNIYYVYRYVPLVQKYTPDGVLRQEFEVSGEAIDLQMEVAGRYLAVKNPRQVGGIHIINSAAIDRRTGHLWLAMNGSSDSGVVYEFNGRGEKQREYALEITTPDSGRSQLTDVGMIVVTNSNLHVLTSLNQVHSFGRGNGPLARARQVSLGALADGASLLNVAWSRTPGGLFAPQQNVCGDAQIWNSCQFQCAGITCQNRQPTPTSSTGVLLDCKAVLEASLETGYTVKSSSCPELPVSSTNPRGGCSASVTICRVSTSGTAQTTTHTTTQSCPAPSPSACEVAFERCPLFELCDSGYAQAPPPDCTCQPVSPIVIDVTGDGFDMTDNANGVWFDINGDGAAERLSWTGVGDDDAWLALERNGNGKVDSGLELFGTFTPQPPSAERNGFLALAEYDKAGNGGNGDGLIDSGDAIYASLRLWQDANHNGTSEPEELHTLPALNVTSVSLDYREAGRRDRWGNKFRYRAKVNGRGASVVGRWAYDVFLKTAP